MHPHYGPHPAVGLGLAMGRANGAACAPGCATDVAWAASAHHDGPAANSARPAEGSLGNRLAEAGFELLSACLFQLTTELIEPHRSVRGHSPICRHGQAAFLQLLIDGSYVWQDLGDQRPSLLGSGLKIWASETRRSTHP